MNREDFDACFDQFRHSATRLETLPSYVVAGEDDRSVRSIRTNGYLERIARDTLSGVRTWTRIRVLDDPLTDYQRRQLRAYVESQAVGEHVRLVHRGDLTIAPADTWLFDLGTATARAVVMDYDPDGRPRSEGYVLITDPDALDALHRATLSLEALAVDLNDFLADVGA